MLDIQQKIVDELDKRSDALLYSVDLSATFDLLRKDISYRTLKDSIDQDLMNITIDFISERKMIVEINGKRFAVKSVPLGCVQGPILGPKLFNLYMKDVAQHVNGFHISTNADDTYVLI